LHNFEQKGKTKQELGAACTWSVDAGEKTLRGRSHTKSSPESRGARALTSKIWGENPRKMKNRG